MLASSPTLQAASARKHLSADHVRELLAAGGYRNASLAASERYGLPEGSAVSLQFGETVAGDHESGPRLTLRCNVALNGRKAYSGTATHWKVCKVVRFSMDDESANLMIEVDLVLGSRVLLDDIAAHGGDMFRHLRLLVADARETLMSLPVGADADAARRALRIEARYVGDLATGRSGFVEVPAARDGRQKTPGSRLRAFRIASRDQLLIGAACDCLSGRILPDLARALRRLILREAVARKRASPCAIGSMPSPAPSRRSIADPLVQPFDAGELATVACEPPS
jgi:hypothetical protein